MNTFGDSWLVNSTEECDGPTESPENPCGDDNEAFMAAADVCYGLIDPDGMMG